MCPKLQVLTFHFSKVKDLLNEYEAKNVQRETILIQIYVQCNNVCWLKFCSQEFVVSCLTNKKNQLQVKNWFKSASCDDSCTCTIIFDILTQTCG